MFATFLMIVTCIVISLQALPSADDDSPQSRIKSLAVTFSPGDPSSSLAPRFSPKGTQLPLALKDYRELKGADHLETRVGIGPDGTREPGQLLVLARSAPGKPYDLLYIDSNRDQKLSEEPIRTTPSITRGKIWSSFSGTFSVSHGKSEGGSLKEEYPVSLWVVVDKDDERPTIIRYSRRGFLTGNIKLGDREHSVVVSDSNNDGVYGVGDWWGIRLVGETKGEINRAIGDYAWAVGKAWKLEMEGTNGRRGALIPFDPGISQEEDALRRDKLRADRLAPRASQPVSFRKDVDQALKEVAERKAPFLLKFETDWCIPCKQMMELVFTAKDVAEVAKGITCIVIDGDARKDLTQKHQVKAYPTGILFDAEGKELARYVGYQSVKETTQFLGKLRR